MNAIEEFVETRKSALNARMAIATGSCGKEDA